MLTSAQVRRAFLEACRLDVEALKPGNVGVHASGHGMRAAQFIRSAQCAAPHIAKTNLPVGKRILGAIEATRAAVHCNTNLGIVLLCAPLAAALHSTLHAVLANLSVQDAVHTFAAINIAAPGGLGKAARHDVREPARITLLTPMRAAADRDRIAHQYASDFDDVFSMGIPTARRFLAKGWSRPWAMTAVFMQFLANFPDTHIQRKYGPELATIVTAEAADRWREFAAQRRPEDSRVALMRWDASLKQRGINPGTSADLAVATWFAMRLEDALKKR